MTTTIDTGIKMIRHGWSDSLGCSSEWRFAAFVHHPKHGIGGEFAPVGKFRHDRGLMENQQRRVLCAKYLCNYFK
jgi:hypothetical protein